MEHGLAIAPGAGVNKDGQLQPHTASRVRKCAELVQYGLAEILVTTGKTSAQAMKDYATQELGIEEDLVWTEPTTWSFINEAKITRTHTIPRFIEYIGHNDLQNIMVHFAMQEWALERFESNVKTYLRYNYNLTSPGNTIPYTIHIAEDGRSVDKIESNKKLELKKKRLDDLIRKMPGHIYLGDWYQIPFALLSKLLKNGNE